MSTSWFLTKAIEQIKPVKVIYNNFKGDRLQLLKDQKDKVGVYYLVNLINGHSYIGSSINLAGRMRNYLNNTFWALRLSLEEALLKYGQDNFAVLIVEYVDVKELTIRETYFLLLAAQRKLLPYYNVLKQGYSSIGYKHTEATKQMLSELAKNRVHSDQTKALISRALTGENNPFYNKTHSVETKLRIIEANSAYPVYIYNSYRELIVVFPSVTTLAKLINSNHSTIVSYIKNKVLFREIKNSSHIKKAIFVYNTNKEFICKLDGVTHAEREFSISHEIIKKYALLNKAYGGYIFSYERLKD
ncbi:hypothetical protein HOY80DRAFT_914371 [Tuber brumale]|nr:hypothetical protein HOY80DRAFT_914371 [Tuber brumale]